MDILTHVLSGIAVGTVAASLSGKDFSSRALVVGAGAVGTLLPDVDAVSRWSGFDRTIGKWLGLAENGRDIYFAGHWYSHHGAMHSILAALLAAAALMGLAYAAHSLTAKKKAPFPRFASDKAVYAVALFLGCMAHVAGDLPTPASSWGGVKLFWPLSATVGGWGNIWWWNNYDIFLLAYLCCIVNLVLLAVLKPRSRAIRIAPVLVFAVTLMAVAYQIQARPVSFNGERSHAQKEADSLKIQRDMLGGTLYGSIKSLDDALARQGIIF